MNIKKIKFDFSFILLISLCIPFEEFCCLAVVLEFNEFPSVSRQKRHTEDGGCQIQNSFIAVNTTERLQQLREKMKENNYSAYIIPTDDEHQSEYVAEYDKRRAYISGFSGSAGTAVVLLNKAALWTDSRYFLQAEDELDCNWILMKQYEENYPEIFEWLTENLSNGSVVGADPRFIKQNTWINLDKKLSNSGIILKGEYKNLIDEIWIESNGRPHQPSGKIFIHQLIYAGKTWEEKINELRKEIRANEADCIIVTALDEIAWLFNLRGSDVPYNPVFKSFAFVSQTQISIYVDVDKVTNEVEQHLSTPSNETYLVNFKNYTSIYTDIENLLDDLGKVLITFHSSYAIYNLIPKEKRIIKTSPIMLMKAVKNPIEIDGMKNAHMKDSIAIIDFIALLEEEVKHGKHWDEIKAMEIISQYRRKQELNMGDSFESISASGSNGAIIHYTSRPATNKTIDTDNMFLLDTGGQYLDGTTDTTRTFHFGNATDFEREAYTRVLMGAIDLASVIFPKGTRDIDVDIFARRHLYQIGLDYKHGTGHGIGLFLNVHEGPTLIREPKLRARASEMKPGMFISDEPGYYEKDKFGIRLETVIMVTEANLPYKFNNITFYKFEPVALVPFEPNLIKYQLLDRSQINWLNSYNLKIREIIGKELLKQNKTKAYNWMMSRTDHIPPVLCDM
ncbi:probable Xaa-Pro aminopeptidase P [Centruroides sculpturatus]|uniref:probable Xaa-Pro aminopeptidase P n=1 Tax=Centruroides sculpturatus TaxID=218467 RepID=UPI000C6DE790|nr:probable Xaa-Pro aminopeptidase P [Centruroides sculpturatus]